MKSIAGYLVAAIVLALAGRVATGIGAFERDMADAEESLATFRYTDAADKLDAAASNEKYARWLPGTGDDAARDLQARQATLRYWQRNYDALLPRDADPVGAVEPENRALQLVVANGAYRSGQMRATSREASMQVLDEAISGYLTVLKGETWDESAAYNYEYLVRLRNDVAKGSTKTLPQPDAETASLGAAGAQMKTAEMDKFEIFVPLESEERSEAAEAGKAAPNKRKG